MSEKIRQLLSEEEVDRTFNLCVKGRRVFYM